MCIRGKKKFRLRVLEFLCVSCRLLKSGDEEGEVRVKEGGSRGKGY